MWCGMLYTAYHSSILLLTRSVLDVMRLVELLMVLMVEGRKALPKTPHPALMAKRMESVAGDRSHRQMIEAIRAGNNEEFYECMDAGESIQSVDTLGHLGGQISCPPTWPML